MGKKTAYFVCFLFCLSVFFCWISVFVLNFCAGYVLFFLFDACTLTLSQVVGFVWLFVSMIGTIWNQYSRYGPIWNQYGP